MIIKLSEIEPSEARLWKDEVDTICREISRYSEPLQELLKALRTAVIRAEDPRGKVTVCIEAYWSGYNSSQERCVHREYRKVQRKKAEEWQSDRKTHRFTDGTYNWYNVKVMQPRQRKDRIIKGYVEITNDLFK